MLGKSSACRWRCGQSQANAAHDVASQLSNAVFTKRNWKLHLRFGGPSKEEISSEKNTLSSVLFQLAQAPAMQSAPIRFFAPKKHKICLLLDLSGLWTSRFHGTLAFLTHAWPTATAYSEDAVSLAPGAGFMLGLHKGGINTEEFGLPRYIVMMGASKPARSEKRHTSACKQLTAPSSAQQLRESWM